MDRVTGGVKHLGVMVKVGARECITSRSVHTKIEVQEWVCAHPQGESLTLTLCNKVERERLSHRQTC